MAQNRQLRPQVSDTVTGAVEKVLLDAVDAGIDLDDIQDKPKIKGKFRPTQESLD